MIYSSLQRLGFGEKWNLPAQEEEEEEEKEEEVSLEQGRQRGKGVCL